VKNVLRTFLEVVVKNVLGSGWVLAFDGLKEPLFIPIRIGIL